MLRYANDMVEIDKLRADHEVVFEILFNSKRKWNLMITKRNDAASMTKTTGPDGDVELLLLMKGAAEILIEMCSTMATENGEVNLDEQEKKKFTVCTED
jgi:magnesium-transporting ATPase (P-type)